MTSQGDAERTAEPAVPAVPVDEPVPRLPRGRGLRLSGPQLLRIAGLSLLLVFLLVTQRPCANAVSKFVTSFDDRGSAAPALPRPGAVGLPAPQPPGAPASQGSQRPPDGYVHLRGLSPDEVKAAVEREQARAAGHDPAP